MKYFGILLVLLCFRFLLCGQTDLRLVEIANGFSSPVALAHADDGSHRLFVVERQGIIKILNLSNGTTHIKPFLDIAAKVESGGEKGLLGLAFHPDYPATPYFFVNYTFRDAGALKTKIERYQVSSIADSADVNSGFQILEVDQPYSNHNAGDIKFGPDEFLYVTMGDGGSGEDPDSLAQNTQNLLGALLRLDIDNDDYPLDNKKNYAIPNDNPFVGMVNFLDEFWAIGLRNPWRISFDRITGDLWIADVGQTSREEINYQTNSNPGGQNYGWSCREGTLVKNFNECIPGPLTDPVFEYPRSDGGSVTGGFVYRGEAFPNLQGYYVFADFSSGNLWTLNTSDFSEFSKDSVATNISTFGESESGEIYLARLGAGAIFRLFDQSECPQSIDIINHNLMEYASEDSIRSGIPVSNIHNITYCSQNIFLENPFEINNGGQFQVISISCTDKIMEQQY